MGRSKEGFGTNKAYIFFLFFRKSQVTGGDTVN